MIILFSPAKKYALKPLDIATSPLLFDEQAKFLNEKLKTYNKKELINVLHLPLSQVDLVYRNIQDYGNQKNTIHAIAFYLGEAYKALDVQSFEKEILDYAQEHLLVFSALYGLLRPLDGIFPYRLDMNAKVTLDIYKNKEQAKNKNLYTYWKNTISEYIQNVSTAHKYIINLASDEFFKMLDGSLIEENTCIKISFFQIHKGKRKSISTRNKQARGLCLQYILKHKVNHLEELRKFNMNNYSIDKEASSDQHIVFLQKDTPQ